MFVWNPALDLHKVAVLEILLFSALPMNPGCRDLLFADGHAWRRAVDAAVKMEGGRTSLQSLKSARSSTDSFYEGFGLCATPEDGGVAAADAARQRRRSRVGNDPASVPVPTSTSTSAR